MPSILSAKSAIAKHAKGISNRFGKSGKRSSTKDILSDNNDQGGTDNTNQDEKEDEAEEPSDKVEVPQGKTVDELRREELREVMKDRSLSKEEKTRRMGEVKQKYGKGDSTTITTKPTAAATGGGADTKSLFLTNKESYEKQLLLDTPAKIIGNTDPNDSEPPSLDSRRRAELQTIMKDKSLEKEERRRKIEEIKEKYAKIAREKGNRVDIDLTAKSYARKPQKELESTPMKSFSERKAMYENQSEIVAGSEYQQRQEKFRTKKDKNSLKVHSKHRTKLSVNVDTTSFALAENGLYGVQRSKKKAVRHEYGGRFY